MGPKLLKENKDQCDLHLEIMNKYNASYTAEKRERDLCIEDLRFAFVPGHQWEETAVTARAKRPRFEINKVAIPVNQIISEQRQNRIAIKVHPVGDGADEDIAELYNGLIRNIENQSHFDEIKDNAFKQSSAGGIGGWYVTTEYESDSFDQHIRLKPIACAATSVYYDPAATDLLKRDANWFIVTEDISKKEFQTRWPDATCASLSSQNQSVANWQSRDTIRIADYWCKTPVMIELALLSDGRTIELTNETKSVLDELATQGITVVKTRKQRSHKVQMYKISQNEILEGPFEWAGKHIPVVLLFGYTTCIDGQHYYKGMVRDAKDAQRVYNYTTSQSVEAAALSPKDPIWMTVAQAQGFEAQLKNFNNTNSPFMFYNPDPQQPGIPQRGGAPSVQNAILQQTQQADLDIQATTGMYSPSLGDATTDQSGRAILALQKQGNLSTYELVSNLEAAVAYTGDILVDLIPRILDTERNIVSMSEAGDIAEVTINQVVIDQQTGRPVVINDLNQGKYGVVSKSGPSYATKRIEGVNLLTKLAESNPSFSNVVGDLIAKSIDFDYSEELTNRVRKQMLAAGVIDPNEKELAALQSQPAPQPTAMDQIAFEAAKLKLELLAAQVDNVEVTNSKVRADYTHKMAETQELLTQVLKLKTQINTELDKQGKPVDMPVEVEELHARAANMRLLNESLQLSDADIAKMHSGQVEDFVTTIQPQPNVDPSQIAGASSVAINTGVDVPGPGGPGGVNQ